jgi:DNA-binding CsgD family transcriptional regulator
MWLAGTTTVPGNLPFRLDFGDFRVGRTKQAAIVIGDATVSRRHARLVRTKNSLRLFDLGSANGTFVNEVPLHGEAPLRIGDCVRFGAIACEISSSPLACHRCGENESTYQIPRPGEPTLIDGLTAAQQAIVAHVVEARTEAEIALLMNKSPHTIHTHLKAIFTRLGVHSRAELIVKLLKRA